MKNNVSLRLTKSKKYGMLPPLLRETAGLRKKTKGAQHVRIYRISTFQPSVDPSDRKRQSKVLTSLTKTKDSDEVRYLLRLTSAAAQEPMRT